MPDAPAPAAPAAPQSLIAPEPPAAPNPAPNAPAAPAATTSNDWLTKWRKPDGSFDHAALDSIPDTDELKGFANILKRYPNEREALKAWQHAVSLTGKKGLHPLPPNATAQEKAEHMEQRRQLLGVPAKPEGYNITRPKEIPEDVWDQGLVDQITKVAHENAIPPEALNALVSSYNKLTLEAFTKAEAEDAEFARKEYEAASKALDEAFGFQRTELTQLAARAFKFFGGDPTNPAFNQNAELIKAFANVGQRIKEPSFVKGEASIAPSAIERLAKMDKNDPLTKALNSANPFERDKAQKEYDDLIEQARRERVKAAG